MLFICLLFVSYIVLVFKNQQTLYPGCNNLYLNTLFVCIKLKIKNMVNFLMVQKIVFIVYLFEF